MSYILDALKKSEKKRQQAEVPNVLTVQDAFLQEPRKRRMWPYLILVVLFVNAGIVLWFFGPWQSRKANVPAPVKQAGTKPQEPPPLVTAKRADQEPGVVREGSGNREVKAAPKETAPEGKALQQKRAAEAQTALQKKGPDKGSPQTDASKASEKQPAATEDDKRSVAVPARQSVQSVAAGQAPTEASTVEEVPPPTPGRIYGLNDLPAVLKQKLPAITISVSLYSDDPASRLVRINGQMMREGQLLSPGLKVEEIVPDGVIFSFQHYRFRIGLK